mmetsp:Transcript_125499/g.401357  ORF Transcript_125499/g.401357 Transcript_125499/m.401357 type:complete len:219 (+) Transcript_125499:531-1187(+)
MPTNRSPIDSPSGPTKWGFAPHQIKDLIWSSRPVLNCTFNSWWFLASCHKGVFPVCLHCSLTFALRRMQCERGFASVRCTDVFIALATALMMEYLLFFVSSKSGCAVAHSLKALQSCCTIVCHTHGWSARAKWISSIFSMLMTRNLQCGGNTTSFSAANAEYFRTEAGKYVLECFCCGPAKWILNTTFPNDSLPPFLASDVDVNAEKHTSLPFSNLSM